MRILFYLLIISFVFIGCVEPEPKQIKIDSKPKTVAPNKAKEIYITPQPYSYYTGSCWDGGKTINCEIKKTYELIRRLNLRIEDSLKGWGGCCDERDVR